MTKAFQWVSDTSNLDGLCVHRVTKSPVVHLGHGVDPVALNDAKSGFPPV